MRILVTGGDGFVGSRLVECLKKQGHAVSLFKGDLTKDELKGSYDVVYHLAAILDESSRDLYDVNVKGTKKVVQFCKNINAKIIYLSSAGILKFGDQPVKEDAAYNPETKYEETKMLAEKEIVESGVRYTVLRSTIILGPNSYWKRIIAAAEKGYPLIGDGENYFHLIYIDDVIDALLWALEKDGLYNLASHDVLKYKQIYQIAAGKPPERHISKNTALLAGYLHVLKSKITGKRPDTVKSPASIKRLLKNRIIDISKLRQAGFVPKWDTEQAMKATKKVFG